MLKVKELPLVVINLDERKDRWETVQKDLNAQGLSHYQRFSAIKPTDQIQQRPDFLPKEKQTYRIGCYGCLLSHYHIIKEAKEQSLPFVLIFEDDAAFKGENPLAIAQQALDQLHKPYDRRRRF